jgi:hypothetical protein
MIAEEREAHDRARRTEAMRVLFEQCVTIAIECGADATAKHGGVRDRLAQVFMVAMVEVE